MRLFTCEGVTRRPFFEDRRLEVEEREIVVLRGATGSGKTLFLRALADLDRPEAGRFCLAGKAREEIPPSTWRRAVLYVHQSAPRLPGTVGENLRRVRELARETPGAAPDALPRLDPEQDAARLSGGEAQLLALHRAFVVQPRVLLLDESTSALDPERARRVETVLGAWAREGHAIVWVSHDEALADRVGARPEVFP